MSKWKTEHPRETIEIYIHCFADPRMFGREFRDLPKEMQDDFAGGLSIPCEGGGVLGTWCERCEFGEVD